MRTKTYYNQITVFFAIACLTVISASQAWGVTYNAIVFNPISCVRFFNSYAMGINGAQQVGFNFDGYSYETHASLWYGSVESYVDLHPIGFRTSGAWGTNGTQQVGYGEGLDGTHALLWSGTAESCVDLNPSGFYESLGRDISGTQQVGYGEGLGGTHALLWSGTAESCVDLNPSGFDGSDAYGISGTRQVGYGSGPATGGNGHALLWNGTADSFIDLHPSRFIYSYAYGINGNQQVGDGDNHALLWNGTADSFIDLHSSGFNGSVAWSTNGRQQVGYGSGPTTGGNTHALVWSGSAESCIDLHQFLPANFTISTAYDIGRNGNIVGYAMDGDNFRAVLWVPDPVPAIEALVEINPVTLNKNSQGQWVTMRITLPADYDIAEIDANTIVITKLTGTDCQTDYYQPADLNFAPQIGNRGEDGIAGLIVKVDRQELAAILCSGDVAITVECKLFSGERFEGIGRLRVIDREK